MALANAFCNYCVWRKLRVSCACFESGTTSKQLSNERYAKRIGYGAVVLEALLAVLALLAVNAGLSAGGLEDYAFKRRSWSDRRIWKRIWSGVDGSYSFWQRQPLVAIMILNAFVLTTLDTATRICRYLSEELFKIKNRFFSTFVVIFTSGALALTGKWNDIWPLFGASNQLVAALSFIVISSWLLCEGKSLKYIILLVIFMLLTSIGALIYQLVSFIKDRE